MPARGVDRSGAVPAVSAAAVTRSQALLVAAHGLKLLLFVGVTSVLGRRLAVADFAFIYLLGAVYIVSQEILDLGTTAIATRDIAADPARERGSLEALFALRRLIAAVLLAAMLVWAWQAEALATGQRSVLVLAAIGVFLLHLHAYQPVFQVRQAYGGALAVGLGGHGLFLLACLVALAGGAGGVVIGVLIVAREALQALCSRWLAVRMLGYRLHPRGWPPGATALLRAGWILGLAGICYKAALYAGIFLFDPAGPPDEAGAFSAAHRLLVPLADVAWIFVVPLFASMSVALTHDIADFRLQVEAFARLLTGLALLAGVCGVALAPTLLALFYGQGALASSASTRVAFQWLSLGAVFALATPVFVVSETVQGRGRALLAIAGTGLLFSLLGSTWALPRHGAQGAAVVLCLFQGGVWLVLAARALARGEVRLDAGWLGYAAPALLLAALMAALPAGPDSAGYLVLACGGAALSLALLLRLPLQRRCRARLAALPAHATSATDGPGAEEGRSR